MKKAYLGNKSLLYTVCGDNTEPCERKGAFTKFVALLFVVFASFTLSAQDIKLVEVVASKVYPEGNQITYFMVTEMPTGQNEIDFIKEYTIKNTDITRLVIFPGKPRCMIDGDEKVNIPEVVSVMNEAMALWRKQNDKPEKN